MYKIKNQQTNKQTKTTLKSRTNSGGSEVQEHSGVVWQGLFLLAQHDTGREIEQAGYLGALQAPKSAFTTPRAPPS